MDLDDIKMNYLDDLSVADLRDLASYCNDLADAIEEDGNE